VKRFTIYFSGYPKETQEFSLIPKMQECRFVTKTRKTLGFHIYWLSHKEHTPIHTTDCKLKLEFEIKVDKSLSTLPPSRHRDRDPEFVCGVAEAEFIIVRCEHMPLTALNCW
jgi:hypothetical protein